MVGWILISKTFSFLIINKSAMGADCSALLLRVIRAMDDFLPRDSPHLKVSKIVPKSNGNEKRRNSIIFHTFEVPSATFSVSIRKERRFFLICPESYFFRIARFACYYC